MHLQSKSLDMRPVWWYTNTCETIFSLIVLRGDVRGYQLQEIMEATHRQGHEEKRPASVRRD